MMKLICVWLDRGGHETCRSMPFDPEVDSVPVDPEAVHVRIVPYIEATGGLIMPKIGAGDD